MAAECLAILIMEHGGVKFVSYVAGYLMQKRKMILWKYATFCSFHSRLSAGINNQQYSQTVQASNASIHFPSALKSI